MMNSAWIDPLLLRTFVAVAETGSFAKAATRVGRTQSAVSMQMKRLEDLAGPPALFARVGRNMVLTARAETIVCFARRVLKAHEDMLQEFNRQGATQEIRLGSPEDYVNALLPKALDRFAVIFPNLEVSVVCDTSEALHRHVAESRIDLAVVTAGKETPIGTAVRQEPLVWVASLDHRPELESVVPLAVFQPGCTSRAVAIDACVEAEISHRVAYSSPSLAGLLPAVRQGLAIAALARCSVPRGLRILSSAERMPRLPSLTISMLRSDAARTRSLVNALADEMRTSLHRS
ncbi:LysR substrate-binding domain-containing protein [Shinella sumterensis]|uniref:DNA-binding transcriptional LysR family regulator n=1 Tax=Rhizobium subbaraonis TaxID=908946 RepID=A0A285UT80_9HYPH|nr:LysR substrate-binding domain-containing protein [Shinella sp.]MCW5712268.1 LysR family transcriptional regulator [Shinella sp.]WLS08680.1 LysR substrate-binding domain-containing protein [Shinella sumterensis]SOC44588.1 DNA-binding transcriptional LysR family regulator [Rhizobium subbaraonis]